MRCYKWLNADFVKFTNEVLRRKEKFLFLNMFMLSINPKKNGSWNANKTTQTTIISRG
jgi:hypothetical protein